MNNQMPSHVCQVVRIKLKDSAKYKLSAHAYERVTDWLKHWTPIANFQATLGFSEDEALNSTRKQLQQSLVPNWFSKESNVTPDLFEFEVSIKEIQHGAFWFNASVVWCHWHSVVED